MKESIIPQLNRIDARRTPFIVLNGATFNLPVLKRFIKTMPDDFTMRFNEETRDLDFVWSEGRGKATIKGITLE